MKCRQSDESAECTAGVSCFYPVFTPNSWWAAKGWSDQSLLCNCSGLWWSSIVAWFCIAASCHCTAKLFGTTGRITTAIVRVAGEIEWLRSDPSIRHLRFILSFSWLSCRRFVYRSIEQQTNLVLDGVLNWQDANFHDFQRGVQYCTAKILGKQSTLCIIILASEEPRAVSALAAILSTAWTWFRKMVQATKLTLLRQVLHRSRASNRFKTQHKTWKYKTYSSPLESCWNICRSVRSWNPDCKVGIYTCGHQKVTLHSWAA